MPQYKRSFLLLTLFAIIAQFSCTSTDIPEKEKNLPEFKDSLELFNYQVKNQPNTNDPLHERSQYFLRQGDIEAAKKDVESGLKLDSTDLRFRLTYANISLATLDLETVKYHYNYIIEKDSNNVAALLGMAKLYALLSNYPKANTIYLNRVLEIDPYNADAYFMRGMIYLSEFKATGNPEGLRRSLSSFQTTIEQNPKYYSAYVQMGVIFDELDSSLALEYYNSALDIYPKSTEAIYNKGMYYQKRGKVDSALSQYQHLLRLDSSIVKAYYNQGYIHLIMTNVLDSAKYYFEEVTKRDPTHYEAYNNLGLTYEQMGNKKAARTNFEKAISINPDFQLAKDNLNAIQ